MIVVASHNRLDLLIELLSQLSNINLGGHEVLIIDTNSKDKEYRNHFKYLKKQYSNFSFSSMIDTTWDSGAYIFSFKNFDAESFIFFQDSIALTNPNIFVEFNTRLKESDVVAFLNFSYHYENEHQRQFVESNVEFHSLPRDAIFGPIFAANKYVLESIPDNWLNIPKNKIEGCGYERKWALIFHALNYKIDWLERDLTSAACSQKYLNKKFFHRL